MESVLTSLECRVEAFISGNPQFLKSTSEIWDSLERNGKISQEDASRATSILFDLLAGQLDGLGIPVSRPLKQEVAVLLQSLHVDNAAGLDESQFREFYAKVVIYAAKSASKGFAVSYGIGIAAGIVSIMAVKGALRSIPVVGLLTSPFMALLPTILVGPALGIAGTYMVKKEGIQRLKERLFSMRDRKPKEQFKRG